MAASFPPVQGVCPMGCGETLFLGHHGHVTCGFLDCPRPSAINEIITNPETHHVVAITDGGFTIKHPLAERIEDDLFRCKLHQALSDFEDIAETTASWSPGLYRLRYNPSKLEEAGELPEWVRERLDG